MNPYICGQKTVDKGCKAIHWGKVEPFKQMIVEPLDSHMGKCELRPLPHSTYKN